MTFSALSICVGAAAFAAAVAVAPANANEKAETAAGPNQPMTLIVSLRNQKVDIYRGTTHITSSRVSTGKRGYATKAGVFSILEKRRRHYSNLYNGAPMPWMQRLTWSGTALHAGVVPGYPASHGCIRLPHSFAPKLFSMTTVGAQVVVAHDSVAPKLIEHEALLQPLPLPMPPSLVKQEEEPKTLRRSSYEAVPVNGSGLPVILAKAEVGTVAPYAREEIPASAPAAHGFAPRNDHTAVMALAPVQVSAAAMIYDDTRVHAIDPTAGPFVGSGSHAIAVKPSGSAKHQRTAVETSDDFMKHQDRLAPQVKAPKAQPGPAISVSAAGLPQPKVSAPTPVVIAMKVPQPQVGAEPQAGPILSVSATALVQPAPEPAFGAVAMMSADDHPPLPSAKPSIIAAKLVAGAAAAAVEAAEPRSTEPLRILITRRTNRDRLRDAQFILSSMGYLEPQNFDGTFGSLTARAIKAFQKANEMPETGAFTDDLAKKLYAVAGKDEPPGGHLFVRQKFASVFDTPVRFRNPDAPLGTHVFMVMNFEPGDTKAQWMSISLEADDDPTTVLDRIVIPDDVRQNLSERLTPGSSLIIAETAINSATLPKGADFLVWDTSKPATVQRASVAPKPRRKKRRVTTTTQRRPTYTRTYRRNPWPF